MAGKSNLTCAGFYLGSASYKDLKNLFIMSRQCEITGKKVKSGNNRPFSLKATKRTFRPNLFKKRMFNPLTGKVERMVLSAKAIKTLKKWAAEGEAKAEAAQATAPKAAGSKEKVEKVKKLTPKQKKEQAAKAEAAKKEEAKPEVAKEMEDK